MDLYSIVGNMGGGSFAGQEMGSSPVEALMVWLKNLDPLVVISTGIEIESVISTLQQEPNDVEIEEQYKNMWKISVAKDAGGEIYLYTVVKTAEE